MKVLHYAVDTQKTLLLIAIGVLSISPFQSIAAEQQQVEQSTQEFGVKLGATRVIYAPNSMGQTLSVSNPQNYPMLVQSRVYAEDMQSKAPFVVTPPLFRLDGLQQSNLRIVRTGGTFANDRESLQWLCVKGIPPKADDLWAKDKDGQPAVKDKISLSLQVSIDNCIKLLIRPESIKGGPEDVASSLAWSRQGKQLKAMNDTPFYINFDSLKVGMVDITNINYVPPFSSSTFPFPNGASGKVTWSVVTDYGGVSPVYQAEIKS
ncbi:molecular chaperone [Edwardsiella hoshinae]|uniref:Molecular chaperone n=1 Tax=Edwardsiella hoshinae TaxID=93378 RepID=A0ABM6EN75_9GAMM|nr:molecular chaperone [Edwardsiella hoshinae]